MKTVPVIVIGFLLWCVPSSAADGEDAGNHVTHGPLLGQVTESGVRVWARTHRPGEFTVRYELEPTRLDQSSTAAHTVLERDQTRWVQLSGLQPQTTYHRPSVGVRLGPVELGAPRAARRRRKPPGDGTVPIGSANV